MKKVFFSIFALAFAGLIISCGSTATAETTSAEKTDAPKPQVVKNETKSDNLELGDVAPPFTLKNVDDSMVSLSDYSDQEGVILIFTCNTCPYAVMYEDRINALHAQYAPQGYPVVAIMPNNVEVKPGDDLAHMKTRAEEKGFEFAYLFDGAQEVYPLYGATRTPHIFLLQNTDEGTIVKYIGAIDNNAQDADAVSEKYLENAIDALKAGNEPDPAFTKAIGCTIKV